jgi:hypothetical protein
VFTGYINLVIFNRLTGSYGAIKLKWGIPLLGTLVLLTTFFIPIGIHGTIAVNDYIYIWPSTADSLRMEFGFIERVLFVFLLLYLNFSLVFICVTWHVGAELLKGIFTRRPGPVDPDVVHMSWLAWGLFLLFGVLMLLVIRNYNEKELLHVSSIWFEIRYAAELVLVAVMSWIGRKGAGAA